MSGTYHVSTDREWSQIFEGPISTIPENLPAGQSILLAIFIQYNITYEEYFTRHF